MVITISTGWRNSSGSTTRDNPPLHGPTHLSPELLVRAYASGIFPMSEGRNDPNVFWVDPELRGVIPLDGFHASKSLAKKVRKKIYDVSFDTDFSAVINACADMPRDGQGTWINDAIIDAYKELHGIGLAHSVECRKDGKLVGGLYGVSLKGVFCGESMFSHATDSSKVALVHLVARLNFGGFKLLDTQFVTDHLERLGAVEMPARTYLEKLDEALQIDAVFYSDAPEGSLWSSVEDVLMQSRTQTS